ncbi:rhombosortase [Marinobacter sp.]|uniref:rhombosortase n=1 Tax=Marinobacter sp. TaxID=50741 RepID=UPI0019E2C90B|nr:rhombosortase [Marinobacter sp.]MBE0486996.1 rhombosortase [Marinobacter sp.]
MSCIALMVAVFVTDPDSYLQYQSDVDRSGESWRLITAHFVHLDWLHLLLNLSGLWLLWLLVGGTFSGDQWVLVVVLLSLSITGGLWVFSPEVGWYVGLSGLLYGMLAAGLVVAIKALRSSFTLVFILVLLKAVYDSFYGPVSLVDVTAHQVITDAHVYGIVSGTVIGATGRLLAGRQDQSG